MKNVLAIAAIILMGLLVVSNATEQKAGGLPNGKTSMISMTSSDDGRNVFLSYTIATANTHELVIFRSTDHGLVWRRVSPINIHWLGQSNSPDQ